jgi:serine/threonine protein kinase
MIEAGKVLQNRYRIDKQIGQGGMGAVYVATDERFGSTVAIKETLCMDDNYRKAIEREARLLNSLKHPALPRVTDHFLEENGQFLVMEFIPGDDLSSILDTAGRPFTFDVVRRWADQLLDALEFLHTQSTPVIHRDIKPQNLKFTPQGQIVLLDFGLAKGNPTDAGVQTAAKSIFGYSRNYASLEQIQGTGTDPRSDIYSLAATLYHLATGHAPEDALTRAMCVLSQQPDPLKRAHTILPAVPQGFSAVLHHALALNAAVRPQNAAAMRAMLREYENVSHMAPTQAGTHVPLAVSPDTQVTKLRSSEPRPQTVRQTEAATEVIGANVSQLTAVRGAGTGSGGDGEVLTSVAPNRNTFAPRKRKFAFAAVAAALLFLACTGVAGVYFLAPSIFSRGNTGGTATEPAGTTTQPSAQDPGGSPAERPVEAEAGTQSPETVSVPQPEKPAEPSTQTPGVSKPSQTRARVPENSKPGGTASTNPQGPPSDDIQVQGIEPPPFQPQQRDPKAPTGRKPGVRVDVDRDAMINDMLRNMKGVPPEVRRNMRITTRPVQPVPNKP